MLQRCVSLWGRLERNSVWAEVLPSVVQQEWSLQGGKVWVWPRMDRRALQHRWVAKTTSTHVHTDTKRRHGHIIHQEDWGRRSVLRSNMTSQEDYRRRVVIFTAIRLTHMLMATHVMTFNVRVYISSTSVDWLRRWNCVPILYFEIFQC